MDPMDPVRNTERGEQLQRFNHKLRHQITNQSTLERVGAMAAAFEVDLVPQADAFEVAALAMRALLLEAMDGASENS